MNRLNGILGFIYLAALSCANASEAAVIRGKVSFTEQPVPVGTVSLHPVVGPSKTAKIDQGAFDFKDVSVGPMRVSISTEGLPSHYAKPETSGLMVDIKEGENAFTLNLVAEGVEVGEVAPPLIAFAADGNSVVNERFRGRTLILAFCSPETLKAAATIEQFKVLKEIRWTYAQRKDFVIISLCADDTEEGTIDVIWNAFMKSQGRVDYGDGPLHFINDSKWWCCTDIGAVNVISTAPRFGVSRYPANFVIGPDGRFLAVRVPNEGLSAAVAKALK